MILCTVEGEELLTFEMTSAMNLLNGACEGDASGPSIGEAWNWPLMALLSRRFERSKVWQKEAVPWPGPNEALWSD